MTMAEDCVAWAKTVVTPEDNPDDVMHGYGVANKIDVRFVDHYDTGQERRWDKEQEMVFAFPDQSIVIASCWTALQHDHGDGIEPQSTWHVGHAEQVTITRYVKIKH